MPAGDKSLRPAGPEGSQLDLRSSHCRFSLGGARIRHLGARGGGATAWAPERTQLAPTEPPAALDGRRARPPAAQCRASARTIGPRVRASIYVFSFSNSGPLHLVAEFV